MYALGLITRCTRSNNRTVSHYPIDFHKETYCSHTSCIIKKLAHSTLYPDNRLNDVKRNNHSMAFKLLKLRCPVYRVTRAEVVDTFMQSLFYRRFINDMISYNLIDSASSSPQETHTSVNESIASNKTKCIELKYQKGEESLTFTNVRQSFVLHVYSTSASRVILYISWCLSRVLRLRINCFICTERRAFLSEATWTVYYVRKSNVSLFSFERRRTEQNVCYRGFQQCRALPSYKRVAPSCTVVVYIHRYIVYILELRIQIVELA